MKKIAIFASGNGTNAEKIINYFNGNKNISIELVLSNNAKAKVLDRAKSHSVTSLSFSRDEFYKSSKIIELLTNKSIDLIVLAGFMWLVPENLINAFSRRIINIHPALLPKYGGKGMYGDFVHKAVSQAKETSTGITIHYVNNKYDEGDIIFQKSFEIEAGEEPHIIAEKIHVLEHTHYPIVIENLLKK